MKKPVLYRLKNVSESSNKQKKRSKLLAEGYLTDEDIKRIRGKLGLTQKAMAEKLGVGLKTFARYENLSVRQGKAMDNLLRILDEYPESLEVIERE
jgi:putative zinc finger/helix-turn-helix YgiT family protein